MSQVGWAYKLKAFSFVIAGLWVGPIAHAADSLIDLKPDDVNAEDVSSVFRDMGVVRRKAMTKAGHFMIANYGSLDFSDSPYSFYGFNLDAGYAINDFWEIYLTSVPFFLVKERSIIGTVKNRVKDQTGRDLTFNFSKPKFQYGGEILWAPAYGKDSLGSRHVVRSDTFFKIGVMQIHYEGDTGLRFHGAVGKTYFLTRWLGLRVAASLNYMQQIVNDKKQFTMLGIVEAGLAYYL